MFPSFSCVALGILVAVAYLAGALDFLERSFQDARFRLTSRAASGDVVVVAIDSDSLAWIGVWPWPRRLYAEVVERLVAAGARRIALDLDFSSASDPDDDARLAEALASAGPNRIALPIFRQLYRGSDGTSTAVDTAPLSSLQDSAALVHVDFQPAADGTIRSVRARYDRQGRNVPTLALWLNPERPAPERITIDFGIDALSIPQLSFADVLEGTFDPQAVAGKHVIVGATANELRDIASVPRYRLLPGPMVHVLVFETLKYGRALREVRGWPVALWTILLTGVFGAVAAHKTLRTVSLTCGGLCLAIVVAAIALQPLASVSLHVSPLLIGLLCGFGAILMRTAQKKDVILREIVNNSFDAIVTFDRDRRVISFNHAAEKLFGYAFQTATGLPLSSLLPSRSDHDALAGQTDKSSPYEGSARRHDGAIFPVEVASSDMRVDGQWIGIAAIRDISERKAQEAELHRLAMHDPLTGLPNRALLQDRAAQAIAAARRSARRLALLLLDLNRFKDVNDTLGHHVGDDLLQQIGPRLRPELREIDTLARLGGDEFAVLLPDVSDIAAACAVAERIVEAFSGPFAISGLEFEVGASIGVALFPQHGGTLGELMQRADVAMYAAKRGGLGFAVYDADADTHSVRRLTLQGDLRRAIEENQLILHYQPKVDTRTGRLVGFEALVRWLHPSHGLIPPNDFVPFAEQTGLVRPLTAWLLDAALRQWHAWRKHGLDVSVAINLSAQSLEDPELASQIRSRLRSHGCPPEKLNLEITETTLMANPDAALSVLSSLAELQCKLSLDDFGTGYSSLSYLQSLPIHELKIDRSFVVSMQRFANAAIIIRSIINLGHSLGFGVVAEGVEDQKSYDALRDLGCEQVQGYFIGPPMAPEALGEWLAKGPWSSTAFRAPRARTGAGSDRQASSTRLADSPWFTP